MKINFALWLVGVYIKNLSIYLGNLGKNIDEK